MVLVAIGSEVFHKDALDERVAFFEAMSDGVFVLDSGPEMAIVVGIIVIIRIDDADLIAEADVIFEAGAATDDQEENLVALVVSLETGRKFGDFARLKLDIGKKMNVIAGG